MPMSAVLPAASEPLEELSPPPIVYFWGGVRSHVNRIAQEYASRLHSEPVLLVVASPHDRAPRPATDSPISPSRTFVLHASDTVQLADSTRRLPAQGESTITGEEIESEAHELLVYPKIVESALRTVARTGAGGAFVLANADRLPQLSPLLGDGLANRLLESFQRHGTTLILTSRELLPFPHLGLECAFEVSSNSSEHWWEAEIRPGVPVSCCSQCPGTEDGAYAHCKPEFRVACPVLTPFREPE
ncbi:MAG TPA: hypothetical protein VEY07_08900 [Thermoplasmata archaeon]|nr:hypothetical protein [Thermoplasmata archaeon]